MENQILIAINHIKYVSKKKPCTLKIFNYLQNNYALNQDYHSVEVKLNELKSNRIIGDSCKIKNPIQEVMNFTTEDEVIIYWENSEDEYNNPHRTTTSPKINTLEITTPVVNISTAQDPQESDINYTKAQLQNFENKLFGKILAFKSYFMDEILSLKDEIKAYPMDTSSSIRHRFDFEIPRRKFVEITSILKGESTWKLWSIRCGHFDVDSTFKIDEISMNSPRGFFYIVSTSNRRNCNTRCFHSIIS